MMVSPPSPTSRPSKDSEQDEGQAVLDLSTVDCGLPSTAAAATPRALLPFAGQYLKIPDQTLCASPESTPTSSMPTTSPKDDSHDSHVSRSVRLAPTPLFLEGRLSWRASRHGVWYNPCSWSPVQGFFHDVRHLWAEYKEDWADLSPGDKLLHVLNAPVLLLLRLTIPPACAQDVEWNKLFASASPVFGGWLLLAGFQVQSQWWWDVATTASVTLAVLIFALTDVSVRPRWSFLLSLGCFVMSVVWIFFLANEVVNVLQAMGIMFNLSEVILSLTVLALGNSLSDVVADPAIALKGHPEMAVAAIYGGQQFNL
eukprot:RCo044657